MDDYKVKLNEIPEIEVYKANLGRIMDINTEELFHSFLGIMILKHTVVMPPIPTIDLTLSSEDLLYRVRKNIDIIKEDLTIVKTYNYPEPIYCKENGRANIKGYSVFYCSNVAATSIIETKPEDKDVYYLSIWKPKTKTILKAANFCKEINKIDSGQLKPMVLISKLKDQISASGVDKTPQLNYLLDFVIDTFKNENKPYNISSWISHYILNVRMDLNGILYQSVEANSFCNMAFHPTFVDNQLCFQKVLKIETIKLENQLIKYKLISVGELESDKIKWRQLKEQEKIDYHNILKVGEDLMKKYQ
jgi:hypothetical protein